MSTVETLGRASAVTGTHLTAALRDYLAGLSGLERVTATYVPYQPGPFMDAAEVHVTARCNGQPCACRIDLGEHLGRTGDDILAPGPHILVVYATRGGIDAVTGPRLQVTNGPAGLAIAPLACRPLFETDTPP